jgi:hypothetical protein
MMRNLMLAAIFLAMYGLGYWRGYSVGDRAASENYEWVLREMERSGLIDVMGDFDMIVPMCEPKTP